MQENPRTEHDLSIQGQAMQFSASSEWTVQRLPRSAVRRSLEWVYQTWRDTGGDRSHALQNLALIRHEAWLSDHHVQRPPVIYTVSCADYAEVVAGVMCGYPRYGHKDFFIQHMAVHPHYMSDETMMDTVLHRLLESAMDESIAMGCYGWVSSSPELNDIPFWRNLGFSKHDDFTYKRMGYFH